MSYRKLAQYFVFAALLITGILVLNQGCPFITAEAAGTIYVDDDTCPGVGSGTSGNPYCAIQDAIDVAIDGDLIDVAEGLYAENLIVPVGLQVTLQGAGKSSTFVDGAGSGRVLEVMATSDVFLSGMTLQNGSAIQGGGVYNNAILELDDCFIKDSTATSAGGGIFNNASADLTISDSIVSANHANDPSASGGGMYLFGTVDISTSLITANHAGGYGGGILIDGTLTLTNSTVSNNYLDTATGTGAGIENNGTMYLTGVTIDGNYMTSLLNSGGGISNNGDATILDSTITSNVSGASGGGILHAYGSLYLGNSIVRGNYLYAGTSSGGGIYAASDAIIENVEISSNSAQNGGGLTANPGTGTVVGLRHVTVSGNSATKGSGILSSASGDTMLVHVTVFNNHVTTGSEAGGLRVYNTVTIVNSIIAGNDNDQCEGVSITSAGYNLSSDSTCHFTGTGDLPNQDPLLGSLRDNGGYSQTHMPAATSPVIDAGRPTDIFPEDQRGYPRPIDGDSNGSALPDIGAVEAWVRLFLPLIAR